MATNIPWMDVGTPGFTTEEFSEQILFTGNPAQIRSSEPVADAAHASAELPILSVVSLDANGAIVLAQYGTPACGITVAAVAAGSTGVSVDIFRDGTFNPAMLNWHASFDTDEKKRRAFQGGDNCQIFIRKPLYG